MFDHVTIRVSDREASQRFYEAALEPLGHAISHSGGYFDEWNDFGIAQAREDRPVTRRLHVAFGSRSREEVNAFWHAGTKAGYASDGEPGPRPEYHDDYYGAFLLDPDGNSAEAVYHGRARKGENVVDHLWIRVADLEATKRFYETIAPIPGLRISHELEERFHVAARRRSLRWCAGSRARTSTSPFRLRTPRRRASSTVARSPPATVTTARRESARAITPATTAPTFSTPTGTTSRPCTTTVRRRTRRGQPGAAR